MSWLLPASFVLHVAVGVSATVLNLLAPDELPHPASGIRAFLVEPAIAPPPPPPPPAPKAAAVRRTAADKADPPTAAFTAPPLTPDHIVANEHLELDVEAAGEVGGVEGGVPGGVVGGIVGGLPPTPSPPPTPIRLEKGVKEPRKLKHVAPSYPELAARANIRGAVVLECLVSQDGRVVQAKVVRTSNPLLDQAALEAVRQWVYERTLVDGVPVPVIFMVTVQFNLG